MREPFYRHACMATALPPLQKKLIERELPKWYLLLEAPLQDCSRHHFWSVFASTHPKGQVPAAIPKGIALGQLLPIHVVETDVVKDSERMACNQVLFQRGCHPLGVDIPQLWKLGTEQELQQVSL